MADHDLRARMRELAERHAVRLVQVEWVCKVAVHHARLADRPPFWPPLVERLRASYEPARPPQALELDMTDDPEVVASRLVDQLAPV